MQSSNTINVFVYRIPRFRDAQWKLFDGSAGWSHSLVSYLCAQTTVQGWSKQQNSVLDTKEFFLDASSAVCLNHVFDINSPLKPLVRF